MFIHRIQIALLLALALALAPAPCAAQAPQGTDFTFQGTLRQGGTLVDGTPNLVFQLYDSVGTAIGAPVSKPAWPVVGGLFTVDLDFGAVFNGDRRLMEITVDGVTLSPRIPISSTPYALAARTALAGSVAAASIVDGSIGAADVDATKIQLRVAASCPLGNAMRTVNQDGSVVCEPVAGGAGDITAIVTPVAGGLVGGAASGDATLSIGNAAVTAAMIAPNAIGSAQMADNAITGAEIANGSINALDVNSGQVQWRVLGACAVGSSISAIAFDGAVTCDNGAARLEPHVDASNGDVPSVVAGASGNTTSGAIGATVAGGGATLSGGSSCIVCRNEASGSWSTSGGGRSNVAGSTYATVAGGSRNYAKATAATVAGGSFNQATGTYSAVGGGDTNIASGHYATVAGGMHSCAGGDYSFAAGFYAKVRERNGVNLCTGAAGPDADGDEATFAWADNIGGDFISTGPNQFLIRSAGGVGINTNAPHAPLHVLTSGSAFAVMPDPGTILLAERDVGNAFITVMGAVGEQRGIIFAEPGSVADGGIFYDNAASNAMQFRTNGNATRMTIGSNGDLSVTAAAFKPGGGSWSVPSDARLKKNIAPLDSALDRLLALRGVSFEYREPDAALHPPGVRIGFVAQEVEHVFPDWVARGTDGYLSVGPQGFEALTVEALRQLARENEQLALDNAALRARLERIERLLERRAP